MKQDAVVIGGGVIGVASAVHLARRGAQVTVLERDRVGHGCSYGNAGWLTPSLAFPLANPSMLFKSLRWMLDPDSPLYIQPRLDPPFVRWLIEFLIASRRSKFERGTAALVDLCRASVDLWEELAGRSAEDFGFERRGLLAVYEHAAALEAARPGVDLVCRAGVRAERWTAAEIREKEPAVIGRQAGGFFYPDDAHCEPYRAVKALEADARALGVRFLEGHEVYRISQAAGARRLTTTRGDITAPQIVVATGVWSERLGGMLGLRVPVIGAKGYSVVLPAGESHPTRSIYLAERKIAVNPHRDALRLAGTLELVRNDFSINARRVDAIVQGARRMLDISAAQAPREIWRGLRPCTPDGMPIIGRAPGRGDVWLATGHHMTGLKTAPGTGLLLAQLMAGETPRFDPEPFRADRY